MIMMMVARASFIKNVGVANCDSFFLHILYIVAENGSLQTIGRFSQFFNKYNTKSTQLAVKLYL